MIREDNNPPPDPGPVAGPDTAEEGDQKQGDPLGTDWAVGSRPDRHEVIYLASPYSSPNLRVEEQRWEMVSQIVALLIEQGHWVYSPIAHSHSIANFGGLEGHFDFWQVFDREMIRRMDSFWIALMPGWEDSSGTQDEWDFAREIGRPVRFVEPLFDEEDGELLMVTVHEEPPEFVLQLLEERNKEIQYNE
jgi:hypothetical protein